MNRIWPDIVSINAMGYPARRKLGRLFSLRWKRTRRVWISGSRQRSATTSSRPIIGAITSRARVISWSSHQQALLRHRRLRDACGSFLRNNTCPRLRSVFCFTISPVSNKLSGSRHQDQPDLFYIQLALLNRNSLCREIPPTQGLLHVIAYTYRLRSHFRCLGSYPGVA
jgi:hypothetical protein